MEAVSEWLYGITEVVTERKEGVGPCLMVDIREQSKNFMGRETGENVCLQPSDVEKIRGKNHEIR